MLPAIATKKQRKVYKYGMKHPYSIFAVDPRLGKSLVGIAIQQTVKKNCLVIAPGYLVLNWKKEIKKWAPEAQVTTFLTGKNIYYPFDADFVVISYNLIQKAEHLFDWAEMVIIDEVHNLKTMSASRTQFIHKGIFEHSIERVHLLSGTILKNRVPEFYSPAAIMHYEPEKKAKSSSQDFGTFIKKEMVHKPKVPGFLDRFTDEIEFADYFAFRKEFKVTVTKKNGAQFQMPVARWEGVRRIDELRKFLKGKYIRVKASEKDLPPVTFKDILISNSPDKKLLKAFEDFFDLDGNDSVRPDIKVAAAMKKVPFTIEYAEDLLRSADCILIYSDHVESAEAIAAHFGVPAITGKMPAKRRAKLADEFQSGRGSVLVSTIGALKEGRDLYRSKHLVFNDFCWVSGDLKQVINRIRGLGQKSRRFVHKILGSPQDQKIWEALIKKQAVIDAAT